MCRRRDHEEHVDLHFLQQIDNFPEILWSAGGSRTLPPKLWICATDSGRNRIGV